MTVKGGMTPYYKADGRLKFAKELVDKHPDVAKIIWRFNRWHHHVDYRKFKANKLKFKKDYERKSDINNYGMELVKLDEKEKKTL